MKMPILYLYTVCERVKNFYNMGFPRSIRSNKSMNSLAKLQLEGIKGGKVFNFQAGNHNPILPAQIGTHPNLSPG